MFSVCKSESWNFLFFLLTDSARRTAPSSARMPPPPPPPLTRQTKTFLHQQFNRQSQAAARRTSASSGSESQVARSRRLWRCGALTVVAFLQDVGRREVHDFLQNERARLLRSRRRCVAVGLERHCHRGFAWHCSAARASNADDAMCPGRGAGRQEAIETPRACVPHRYRKKNERQQRRARSLFHRSG